MTSASARVVAESWESLFRAQVSIVRRLAEDDIWDPISMREYDVLFTLSRCPGTGLRVRELTREILLSQPSLSRMIERLHSRGLVARHAAPGDGRGTVVVLTPEGDAMRRRIGRKHVASIRRTLGPVLDDDELAQLRRLCDKISSAPTTAGNAPDTFVPQRDRTS